MIFQKIIFGIWDLVTTIDRVENAIKKHCSIIYRKNTGVATSPVTAPKSGLRQKIGRVTEPFTVLSPYYPTLVS